MKIESSLIYACKQFDSTKQKELYCILLPYLMAVCLRYIDDKAAAQDVLQESFISIFKKIDQFDETKGVFHKWAVRVVVNTTFNYNKKNKKYRVEELVVDTHDYIEVEDTVEDINDEKLIQLMSVMPMELYKVFNLYVVEEYSHKEIGQLLKISTELSRKKLSRARKWIQMAIAKDEKISTTC